MADFIKTVKRRIEASKIYPVFCMAPIPISTINALFSKSYDAIQIAMGMYLVQSAPTGKLEITQATGIPIESPDKTISPPYTTLSSCITAFLTHFRMPGTNSLCTNSTFIVLDSRTLDDSTVLTMHTYQYEGLSSPKTTIARAEFELPMEVLLPVEMGTKWLNEGSIDHLEGEEYVYRWEGYREKSGSAVLADQPGDRLVVEGA